MPAWCHIPGAGGAARGPPAARAARPPAGGARGFACAPSARSDSLARPHRDSAVAMPQGGRMEPKRVALAAVAAALCAASGAHAGPWSLAPGEYYAELSGSFYSAGTFYDDAGARRPLGGLAEQRAVT